VLEVVLPGVSCMDVIAAYLRRSETARITRLDMLD
jgi:hypothetical protein